MDALWVSKERIGHGGGTSYALVHCMNVGRKNAGYELDLVGLELRRESYGFDVHKMLLTMLSKALLDIHIALECTSTLPVPCPVLLLVW